MVENFEHVNNFFFDFCHDLPDVHGFEWIVLKLAAKADVGDGTLQRLQFGSSLVLLVLLDAFHDVWLYIPKGSRIVDGLLYSHIVFDPLKVVVARETLKHQILLDDLVVVTLHGQVNDVDAVVILLE